MSPDGSTDSWHADVAFIHAVSGQHYFVDVTVVNFDADSYMARCRRPGDVERLLVAEEQAKRAARMEAEAKDAKQELAKRMDAGRAMLGEVYRSYEEVLKDNRQLRVRLAKVDKLRQEAGLRVENALASEKRAKDFVEVLKGQPRDGRGGADPDDQAQALRAAELCLHAEIALRHDAEAKVARLNLQRRGDQARLVQLQSELREADARAEEVSSQMRGGPFAGF
jgi:CRISPR/Cas system-associated exonuclease Cas4 (RecB family)